jgi:hypothetical protein
MPRKPLRLDPRGCSAMRRSPIVPASATFSTASGSAGSWRGSIARKDASSSPERSLSVDLDPSSNLASAGVRGLVGNGRLTIGRRARGRRIKACDCNAASESSSRFRVQPCRVSSSVPPRRPSSPVPRAKASLFRVSFVRSFPSRSRSLRQGRNGSMK